MEWCIQIIFLQILKIFLHESLLFIINLFNYLIMSVETNICIYILEFW